MLRVVPLRVKWFQKDFQCVTKRKRKGVTEEGNMGERYMSLLLPGILFLATKCDLNKGKDT